MRIRRKPWARKELDECEFYIDKPEVYKNKWGEYFENKTPIHIELGCGKGQFISKLATRNLNINYIAADMIEAMLGLSKRNIEVEYEKIQEEKNNIALIRVNVEQIGSVIGEKDSVERIYINFCNPWPRKKHKKRRLTHTRQLEQYKTFLIDGGEIYFKTDDDELFEESMEYFLESEFEIINKTYDLHNDFIFDNILTEHEEMFMAQGIKIKALIAKKKLGKD